MNSLNSIKQTLREYKPAIQDKYNVEKIGVFGSYARGEQQPESDIDILVEFSKPVDFFEYFELEELLHNALGLKIDMVSVKALKPVIGKYILEEVQFI
jgi:uncharacterized protein